VKKLLWLSPLLFVGGCAAVQSVGVWMGVLEPDGTVSDTGEAMSAGLAMWTGVSFARIWDFFQKRGLQNAKNIVNKETGFLSSMQSLAAWLLGWHTPSDAKKQGEVG